MGTSRSNHRIWGALGWRFPCHCWEWIRRLGSIGLRARRLVRLVEVGWMRTIYLLGVGRWMIPPSRMSLPLRMGRSICKQGRQIPWELGSLLWQTEQMVRVRCWKCTKWERCGGRAHGNWSQGCVGMPRKKYSQTQLKKWSASRFPHFELCTHTDKRQWNFTCLSFRVFCNWFSEQITIMALTMLNLIEIEGISYCESAPRKKSRFVLISSEVCIWGGDGSPAPSLPALREEGKRTFLSSSALAMNLLEMYYKWAPVEQPLKMKVVSEQINVALLVRWLICSKLNEPLKETSGFLVPNQLW